MISVRNVRALTATWSILFRWIPGHGGFFRGGVWRYTVLNEKDKMGAIHWPTQTDPNGPVTDRWWFQVTCFLKTRGIDSNLTHIFFRWGVQGYSSIGVNVATWKQRSLLIAIVDASGSLTPKLMVGIPPKKWRDNVVVPKVVP